MYKARRTALKAKQRWRNYNTQQETMSSENTLLDKEKFKH